MGRKSRYTAKTADRHKLYQLAVQCPEADVEFLDRVFREEIGRRPLSLREDFCGTALLCREWALSKKGRTAVGVDLDEETLEWGKKNNVAPMGDDASRVQLILGDVFEVDSEPVDILVAFNFSYCLFTERNRLVDYFKRAYELTADDGFFVLDVHGGHEATQIMKDDPKKLGGFTYIWEQAEYNPLTGFQKCHINFKFPDGTKMKRAFSYEWRHYSMPEVRDALADAGFAWSDVYWEGEDDDGEGNGVYEKVEDPEDDPSWIAYVVARKAL